ncbi:hypothetical protein C0991_002051 [Blastosporella zonata]|nr:hypothetical protein C0991_002051 [Blastosporella zonata]
MTPRKGQTPIKSESPPATHVPLPPQPAPTSQPQYLVYPQYLAYARLLPPLTLPSAQAGPSTLPRTPQNPRTYTLSTKVEHSPLPPSSPPPASSPVATPQRPLVNLVSSPGPMGPLPEAEEYDKLPYTLPPGPYSPHKPDLSYAALVGQAILSSPKHRLTLQEIYDWITIVYPHFKRGETTWMNSIRHVLSTTICFRKVPRERSIGRTLWAIWDEDLECFKGGGFRKHLCKDIIQSLTAKGKARKRADTDDGTDSRKPKRARKEPAGITTGPTATSCMPATMSAHPLFPPTRPTTHHQPYYESCMQPQTLPADVIFPPLPAGIGYSRFFSASESSMAAPQPKSDQEQKESGSDSPKATPIALSESSSSAASSLPDLTPNCSSSSPPPESSDLAAATSCIDDVNLDEYITIGGDSDDDDETPGDDEENAFSQSLLSPVKYWGILPKTTEKSKAPGPSLDSGIKLEIGGMLSSDDDHQPFWMRSKGSPEGRKLNKKISFPPIPTSPTLNRKSASHLSKVSKPHSGRKSLDAERPTTPTPSTPPRSARQLPVSSIRTPLSSKGINPAALYSEGDDDDVHTGELDLNRTPRKRIVSSGASGAGPVTPRRLVFPTNQNDSPFSTPVGSGGIFSPFRTPGSRSVFDPHDPGALLDEELNRMGAGDSPADYDQPRLTQGTNNNTQTPPPSTFAPPSRHLERANVPIRAATYNSHEHDRNLSASPYPPHARSEDLNHTSSSSYPPPVSGSSPRPSPAFLASAGSSRPSTPASTNHKLTSSSGHSNPLAHRTSSASLASSHSESSSQGKPPPTTLSSTSASLTNTHCSACGKSMQGPFVRALGTVFHLNCFKCMDCGDVVASKFFPIEGADGQQQPLCERDYFRRLNLICAKCNMALRGSYITACNKKFHVEHFTCSLCSTLFGPQDSYYEHEGDVYCHFHYSTRFATKCAGCNSAILKQFVEINRNARDECWHPECYMINKFWNVKVVSPRPTSSIDLEDVLQEPAYVEEEKRETPASLKEKQVRMEQQVYRIWTVLSAFEESSAACISDMLRQVSNGQYLDAIRMAERFILHVEVLFATIDDLEYYFARLNMKGMSHVREARMLCRKTVELFTLLSHTQETGSRRMGMTQELLALVTGLAHYLKILIRIALTGALKLEREQSVREAMGSFLDKLHLLAVQGANPAARRMNKGQNGELIPPSTGGNFGTQGVMYGFRSLAPENAGDSPFREGPTKVSSSNPPSDLCVKCSLTVEEDCVRLVAAIPILKEPTPKNSDDKDGKEVTKDQAPKLSTARRPPANVGAFVYEVDSRRETTSFGDVPSVILCTDHAHGGCRGGFQPVQRLEQYAFLLNVALRRLYLLLKKQGVVPLSPVATTQDQSSDPDPYRSSPDIMRMKSVHLDRKLSATARLPKRSTIVESPAGRSVHPSDVLQPQRQQEHHPTSQIAPYQQGQAGQVQYYGQSHHQQHSSPPISQRPAPPYLGKLNDPSQSSGPSRQGLSRTNTEVMIVDDSAPNSPAEGNPPISNSRLDDGITLADIPQIMEAAQAREQQRSLPRESSIPYIAELSSMELAIVKHAAVLVLTRSPLKDQFDLDELLEMVETKKTGFWKTLFKNDKKNIKKKGVFGVPLDFLVEREGSDSMLGATREPLRVPSFIDDVISAMKQMDMSIEGIFRKNGNIRRLKDLTEAIDRDPASVDLTQDNPVQLAALLKKFLRDLPDPLMTFKLHRLFIATQSLTTDAERTKYLHLVSLILPKSHRDTMEILFVFLKWVASFAHMDAETGSKMDLSNLATVICPSILYARGRDAMRDETFGGLRVITSLLEHQDEFFVVPEEFVAMLHDQEYFSNCLDLPGKEFMRKCDTYMKVRGVNGRSQSTPVNGANNGGPRYSNQNPGGPDRPALGPSQSERTIRPPPPASTSSHQQPSSYGSPPQASMPPPPQSAPQALQRMPQQEQWSGAAPRPINPNASFRPSSYLGSSRSSPDPSTLHPSNHGYPSAVRQQT